MRVLILDSTKKIQVVMSGAPATTNPDYTTHYADANASAFTELSNDGTLNGTTPVDVVTSPAASTNRIIRAMTVQNRDTAAVTITVSLVSAGGTRQIFSGTLSIGDTWTLEGTYNTTGNLKTGGYTHPNHSGDVTSVADGATTIGALKVATGMVQDDAITYAKMQNVVADERLLGNIAGAGGVVTELTPAETRTMINVADGANNYVHPNHSGDVTSVADGAQTIAADAVTYAKMQNVVANNVLLGNNAGAGGIVAELSAASVLTLLGAYSNTVIQVFTATGASTYTPTSGMNHCLVITTGGGAGGGGADTDGTSGAVGVGSGGGAGGTCIERFTAADIGANQTVTIGTGGAAGSATNGTDGGVGVNSTFGALHTGVGGGVGVGSGVSAVDFQSTAGGTGGTPTGGLLNIIGGDGTNGIAGSADGTTDITFALGGQGGSSFWGGGGKGGGAAQVVLTTDATQAGSIGKAFGSGGGGGANNNATAGVAGGAGANGVCMVIEYM